MTDDNTRITRRRFCTDACAVTSGITVATLLSACGSGSSPSSPSSSSSSTPVMLAALSGVFSGSAVKITAAGSPLADVGGAALVQSVAGEFLVARTSASACSAVEAVCTHEGCTITGTDGAIYVCPCHGSRYDRSGHVVGGPATASLRQYAATFVDGVVTIAV
jgi:Rieske Fe-S protein